MSYKLHCGDCREVMAAMPEASADAIVTDPPYGLAFMGQGWDHAVPGVEFWAAALRVAKPGAHLLAFGGTRTFHRLACAIEDAGWELRDTLMWVYGSGFPKSMDVSKALDKMAGAERDVVGTEKRSQARSQGWDRPWMQEQMQAAQNTVCEYAITAPATDAAKQWHGWGTALKPSFEPVIVARKPLAGTVAANVLAYGTGAINVDACRVPHDGSGCWGDHGQDPAQHESQPGYCGGFGLSGSKRDPGGRWPANVVHDGSDEVLAAFPDDAARFFYCAKASKQDRDEGCDALPERQATGGGGGIGDYLEDVNSPSGKYGSEKAPARNHHPTVKPTALMRWLVRLVAPPGALVLDPFMGSGSTGKAAILEGCRFSGIDLNPEYVAIAEARIAHVARQPQLFATKGDAE